jgi:polyhydroxybutyrate depolymerase
MGVLSRIDAETPRRNRTAADGVVSGTYEIEVQGFVRSYLLIRPRGIDPGTIPAIIDLHGSGSWPEEHVAITGARSSAVIGAVVVVPRAGIPFRFPAESPAGWAWNVPGSPLPGETIAREEPDDIAFLDALIIRLIDRHGVDPDRIHLRGFSGGARLSSHVMAKVPDRLRSTCCIAGVRFVEPSSSRLPPMLAVHGARDAVNPYQGGAGPRWSESVESAVRRWATAARCAPMPQCPNSVGDIREVRYADAAGFAAVRLVTVADAAHSWPGTAHRDHIAQFGPPGSFDAAQAHRDFVREVELRRPPSRVRPTAGDPGQST